MYTILVLVSLAAAVSCHHAIPDPFGDDSVGQARIKRLGELDDSISRLVARAMNLKSALTQRLKNKEEADRKAKNILLRLDRMNVDDGVQRCADTDKDFRCRRSSKCIKNILVCDGKKDCDDGTDEDKDLCKFAPSVGEEWTGPQIWWRCTPEDASENTNITFLFRKFETNPGRKSVNTVETTLYWVDDYSDGSKYIRSAPANGHFDYARQRVETRFGHDGMDVLMTLSFSETSRDIFMVDSYRNNGEHCHHGILFKKTW